ITLWVDIIIVDRIRKIEFVIIPAVQRGTLILRGYVGVSPLKIWLNIVHPAKVRLSELYAVCERKVYLWNSLYGC
ncbi:MAG: hypothetical protein ABIQ11_12230, partial [Saprospiraceae bacterium]